MLFVALSLGASAQEQPYLQVDYELQPIVVTATRTPRLLWESNANVFVLTEEEIRQFLAVHLGDVLKLIPGVTIGEYGGLGQNVSLGLRGSTAGQVLVLVDGVPVNDLQLGTADLNLICLDTIERIEVIRGAASALYGANAMGGVINVVTRRATVPRAISALSYRQGEHGLEKITGRLARPLGLGLSFYVLGSNIEYDGFRENGDYTGRHFDAQASYRLGTSGQLTYSTQYYKADLGVPGMENLPTLRARQGDESWNQTLRMETSLGQSHHLRGTVYRQSSHQEFDNPDWFIDATHRRWIHGAEIQHTLSAWNPHLVTWGGEIQRRRLDSSENGQHQLDRGALFAQDEVILRGGLRARLAVRYDHHQGFDDQISPDVSFTWLVSPGLSLFTSLRRAYRAPTFNDLYWPQAQYDYDADNQFDYGERGNQNIKPEQAMSVQIGMRGRGGPLAGDLCLFQRRVKDLIQWDNVDEDYAFGYWMPVNTARARIQGLEIHLQGIMFENLVGRLSYTYLDARDDRTERLLPYQPHHQLATYVQYEMTFIPEQLQVIGRVEIEAIGKRYADSDQTQRLAPETLLSASITARFLQHLTAYLAAKNLLDRRYALRFGYPLPGRTFSAGLTWTFWD
jgi:outer membrane receptor for ferrienterochelin and colicins